MMADVKTTWIVVDGDNVPLLTQEQPLEGEASSEEVTNEYPWQVQTGAGEMVLRVRHVEEQYFTDVHSAHPGCVLRGPLEDDQ